MDKKFWLAALAVFVVFVLYGYIAYELLFKSFITAVWAGLAREQALFWPYLLSTALIAVLMAFIYPKPDKLEVKKIKDKR